MSAAAASNNRESEGSSFLSRSGDSQLDRLRDRVDYLQDRVGSDAALQRHIEAMLTQALRQSSAGRPEEMAAILAPAVITAIQDEIRYSPEAVAEVLRPLARPMAKQIIGSMFSELARMVGVGVELAISPWRWLKTGSAQPLDQEYDKNFVVRDCLLIHRATGLLVVREPISPNQGRTVDAGYVGDVTGAIVSFVRRAFSDRETGGPAILTFGGRHWMVRAGIDEILAFSFSGTEPAGLGQRFIKIGHWLEKGWGRELRDFAGALPVDRERALCRDLHSQLADINRTKAKPQLPTWRQRLSRWVLAAMVIGLLIFAGIWRYDANRTADIDHMLVSLVDGHPDLLGYPLAVNFDRGTEHIHLRGLMPNRQVAESMVEALYQATGFPVVRMFGILSADRVGTDGRPVTEVMGELGSNVRILSNDLSDLASSVAQSERANADWRQVQTDRLGRLAAQVAPPLSPDGQEAGNALAAWGLANPIDVDLGAWSVDMTALEGLSPLAERLSASQYIGLRVLSVDRPSDPGAISQALQLVRDQLVARGFPDAIIVNRQSGTPPVVRQTSDDPGPQIIAIRLEVVDLSRL